MPSSAKRSTPTMTARSKKRTCRLLASCSSSFIMPLPKDARRWMAARPNWPACAPARRLASRFEPYVESRLLLRLSMMAFGWIGACARSVTSPRSLRGEVGNSAKLIFRVRGEARLLHAGDTCRTARAPHPNPLPPKSGERESDRSPLLLNLNSSRCRCDSDSAGNPLAGRRKQLAGEDAGGMKHLLLRQVAEGKLCDEIVRAGLRGHAAHLVADRAGRTGERTAIFDHCVKIFRNPGVARLGAVLVPELHEVRIKQRPGPAPELHRRAIGIGGNHEAVDSQQRNVIRCISGRRPFGPIAVGDFADFCHRPGAHDVDSVLRRPRRALGHRHRVPERRMRKLSGLYLHRHGFEMGVICLEGDLLLPQRLPYFIVS